MPLIMIELKQSAILNPNMDSYVIVIERMIFILRCSSLFSSSCNFFLWKIYSVNFSELHVQQCNVTEKSCKIDDL